MTLLLSNGSYVLFNTPLYFHGVDLSNPLVLCSLPNVPQNHIIFWLVAVGKQSIMSSETSVCPAGGVEDDVALCRGTSPFTADQTKQARRQLLLIVASSAVLRWNEFLSHSGRTGHFIRYNAPCCCCWHKWLISQSDGPVRSGVSAQENLFCLFVFVCYA